MNNSRQLQGGLIGCGFVSPHHIEGWKTIPTAQIVALCDLDPSRLETAGTRLPGARLYQDAGSMLTSEPLDFVEICTPPESHRPLVELAARRGIHVLCQKPAAPTRPELLAMIEACDSARVRLMIHENWRFRPWYRALRTEIESGAIGRPIRLRLAHRDTRALRPDGFADQPFLTTRPRLILLEMGCHLVDTARFLLGEIASVSATLGRFGDGHAGEDLATLSVRFANGSFGLLDMSWCASPDTSRPEWALNETVVEGTTGALRLRDDGSLQRTGLHGETEPKPVHLPPPDRVYVDGYAATQAHFLAGLLGEFPHETSGTDTLKTMDVVWAAYLSDQEQRTIPIPDLSRQPASASPTTID